jgi:hypothetical protein
MVALVATLLCAVATLGPTSAGAQVDAAGPTPRDPDAAASAGVL